MNTIKKLTSLSFFSGCGGLDLGLEKAGIDQLLFCDFDKHCRKTLAENRPNIPIIENILNYSSDDIRKIAGLKKGQSPTLVVGGPPCQAFSTAGARRSFNDPRGNVFLRYIELIEELQPEYAVIENVRGLLSAPLKLRPYDERGESNPPLSDDEKKGGALAHVLDWLHKIGYGVSFNLYNSANYGVPQSRERIILIASRDGSKVPFLQPTNSKNSEFGLDNWRTFGDAVKGLNNSDADYINFPEKRLKYFRMLKAGQYWKHLPLDLQKEALGKSFYLGGGKTGFLRRVALDKPCPTLVTHPAMPATDLGHPLKDRPLSIQEYKRIQMFPDNWIISGNLIQQYKQIGNAVPVGLGVAVGKAILNHINGFAPKERFIDFPYSRYKKTNHVTWRKALETNINKEKKMNF
ncbi:DNA cytosine methyltransferase [Methylophilaceae bacterium]|nr:DNA cytosine methyltransferase [Methylophilaceae bacterium]